MSADVINSLDVVEPSLSAEETEEIDEVAEEDLNEEETEDISAVSSFQQRIYHCLQASKTLKPINVRVINDSYWYAQRKVLGGRKHMALIVEQNKSTLRWESYMFTLRPREEDNAMVPQRKFLSTHSSRYNGYRHAEQSCKKRDSLPEMAKYMSEDELLQTHFRIQVVSAAFHRLGNLDRVALVYGELLRGVGSYPSLSHPQHFTPPSRMKLGSIFGPRTCRLPIFLALPHSQPLTFIVEAVTPSQWKPQLYPPPLSERHGGSHLDIKTPHVQPTVKFQATAKRLKLLSTSAATSRLDASAMTLDKSATLSEALGVETELLGNRFGKKVGGVYSHFFRDLTPGVKDMVMQLVKANKQLIQREGARLTNVKKKRGNITELNQPKTTMSLLRAKVKASATLSEYDKGTNSEGEMIEHYLVSAKQIERVVVRLQRQWRIRMGCKALRLIWRRQYAAITIQRVLRGFYSRQYYSLLHRLVPIAAIKIQRSYRFHTRRKRIIKKWRRIFRAVRMIAPLIKRFVRMNYEAWIKKYEGSAIVIQSALRMHLAKIKYYTIHGNRFFNEYIPKQATLIQSCYRRYRAILRVREKRELMLIVTVDNPAATTIQRVQRGIIGRRIYERKKLEHFSAIAIQRYVMGYHCRMCYKRLLRVLLERFSATQIQRVVRGRIDREIVEKRRYKKWYVDVYIPTVIKLQAVVRRHSAKMMVFHIRRRRRASICIQCAWRCYCARLVLTEKRRLEFIRKQGLVAAKIQKVVRAYLARRVFRARLYSEVGRRLIAAKKIMRAWVNFRNYRRFQKLMDEHKLKLYFNRALKMKKCREELEEDIIEIRKDIQEASNAMIKVRKRAKELDTFIIETELRLPEIERELLTMGVEDVERGWGESFGLEFEELSQQKAMAREELRLRRGQLKRAQDEERELYCELEESELELDRISLREVECYERLRQAEIIRIERILNQIRQRNIRIERCRWKVASNRLKVLRRNKDYFRGFQEKVQESRGMDYATTISSEKRFAQRDREEIELKRAEKKKYASLTSEYKYDTTK